MARLVFFLFAAVSATKVSPVAKVIELLDELTGKETRPPPRAYLLHFLSIFWKVVFAVVPGPVHPARHLHRLARGATVAGFGALPAARQA